MIKKLLWLFCFAVLIAATGFLYAAEHGGKEHGGKEHGGAVAAAPSKKDIHKAMQVYIAEQSKKTGALEVYDEELRKTRRLKLVRIHDRVGKTGDYYYSCADFKDLDSAQMLDLDLDVAYQDEKLEVVEVRIHKVGGKARYTYDEHDNRIPLSE